MPRVVLLDEEILRRLERNDPSVDGVQIDADNWIEGAGRSIGNSLFLKEIQIDILPLDEVGNNQWNWLEELLLGLARNRSISALRLGNCRYHPCVILDVDVFQILAPFFERNFCLRSVEVNWIDLSRTFTSLVSALSKCKDKQLERIVVQNINSSDAQVATLFDALGCQDLVEIRYCNNVIGRKGCMSLANLTGLEIGRPISVG